MAMVRGAVFDPVAAGARRGLSRAMALELWRGILQEVADFDGISDEAEAKERFLQLADRLACRAAA